MNLSANFHKVRAWYEGQMRQIRLWPAYTKAGFGIVVSLFLAVILAAIWPGSTKRAGEWVPLLGDAGLGSAVETAYQPETGRLQLRLNQQALAQAVPDAKKQRWVAAHVRRFNRQFKNRAFDARKIPGDSIFNVALVNVNGSLRPRLSIRDLSPFNTHPKSRRSSTQLGGLFLKPGNQPTPFLSDGFLGLSLEPGEGPSQTISLDKPGLYHAHKFHLVDRKGGSVATVWSSDDGSEVFVQGEAGRGVFVDNNAPMDNQQRGLKAGELVEVAGRFFEVRIEAAPVVALSAERGSSEKRVYPMGANLHFVGPVSRNGAHQSLGLEYMFQEYLSGLPEAKIPAGDLWLTLDPRLQSLWVAGIADLANKSERKTATGMLMNAKTGAILAMAANPQPYDPGDSHYVLQMLDRGEEKFANHGCFRRHVIGSVTKPFFAFLALNLLPDWQNAQIEVNGSGSATLFGHRIFGKAGKQMEFKRNSIGFGDYLIQSDNAFQHSLGLLMLGGLEDFNQIPSPWRVNHPQKGLVLRPTAKGKAPLSLGTLGVQGRDSLSVPRERALADMARQIFDLETSLSGQVGNDRDLGIYRQILPLAKRILQRHYPRLMRPEDVLLRRSVVCAPESPRLALEAVSNTKDASNLLFGGKFNLWTDVKLCEAFSRMTTGHKTQATLIHSYRDTLAGGEIVDAVTEAPMFQIPQEIRDASVFRTIRNHLAGVVNTGTAKALRPAIAAIRKNPSDANFRVLAKTGTIDDLEGSDSRLLLATFGLWDSQQQAFQGDAYTFVLYLRNAIAEEDILTFVSNQLPQWWSLLQPPPIP